MPTQSYRVTAHNYAHDSDNKIHDDATAARYGFEGGLVPGVADYAYLSRAAFALWGEPWLRGGTMEAKFIKPVYHGEVARACASDDNGDGTATLTLFNSHDVPCAIGHARRHDSTPPPAIADWPHRDPLLPDERPEPTIDAFVAGRVLGSVDYIHDARAAYASSRSLFVEPMPGPDRTAPWHPALCLWYANQLVKQNIQLQAWVHTASRVHYFDQPVDGEAVSLRGRVADTGDKRGHVVTELQLALFGADNRALAAIRHSAIIRLATAPA